MGTGWAEKMARKTYKERVKQINFIQGYEYDGEIMPFVHFYKFLAKRQTTQLSNKFDQLQLYIPDTIVYNDAQEPYWLYSTYEGYVQRATKFDERDVIKKLGNPLRIDEVVAVVKSQDYDEKTGKPYGNKIELLSTRYLTEKAISLNGQQSNDVTVIQKFVRSKGPYAFICRAVWRRHKPAYTWVITNKVRFKDQEQCPQFQDRYVTKVNNTLHCSFVKAKGDKNYDQIVQNAQKIAMFVERNTNLKMSELAADFIKDPAGIWWLVGIKAFKLEESYAKPVFKAFMPSHDLMPSDDEEQVENKNRKLQEKATEYVKLRICRFCQIGYPVEELNYNLTLKMILKTERLLMNLGYFYEWLNHGDESMYEDISLYKPFSACVNCYAIFKEVDELQQVQIQLSRALGIPVRVDKENNVIFSDASKKQASSGDLLVAMFKQQNESKNIVEKTKSSIAQKLSNTLLSGMSNPASHRKLSVTASENDDQEAKALPTKQLNRFKIFLIFYDLHQIPPEFYDKYPYLYLEYELMRYKGKIKIKPNNYDRQNEQVGINKKIKIKLSGGKNEIKELGTASFSLKDFKNELVTRKGFNVPLLGQDVFIKAIACIDMTPHQVNVTRIKLEYYNGIYVPNEDYFASDFLLDEWMPLIPKNDNPGRQSTLDSPRNSPRNMRSLSSDNLVFNRLSIVKRDFSIRDEQQSPLPRHSQSQSVSMMQTPQQTSNLRERFHIKPFFNIKENDSNIVRKIQRPLTSKPRIDSERQSIQQSQNIHARSLSSNQKADQQYSQNRLTQVMKWKKQEVDSIIDNQKQIKKLKKSSTVVNLKQIQKQKRQIIDQVRLQNQFSENETLPPIETRAGLQNDFSVQNQQLYMTKQYDGMSRGSLMTGDTQIQTHRYPKIQSERHSVSSQQTNIQTYQINIVIDNAYMGDQNFQSNDWQVYYKLFNSLIFQKLMKSQKQGSSQINFGGATKEILLDGNLQQIETLIRENHYLLLILQNQHEKGTTFDCKIDLRGLLVRDLGFDNEFGSKIDGVYELTKKTRSVNLNKDLNEVNESQDQVQFLKAKVILKQSRTNIHDFSRMSDKTRLEIRQINSSQQQNSKINIVSTK